MIETRERGGRCSRRGRASPTGRGKWLGFYLKGNENLLEKFSQGNVLYNLYLIGYSGEGGVREASQELLQQTRPDAGGLY